MAVSQTQRWCPTCGKPTLHLRYHSGFAVGCLLTIVASLFLMLILGPLSFVVCLALWFLASLVQALSIPYRCQQCGEGQMTFVQQAVLVFAIALIAMVAVAFIAARYMRDRPVANGPIETNSLDEPPNPPVAPQIRPAKPPLAEAKAIETNSPKEPPKPVQSELPATKPAQPVPEGQPTVGSIARFKDSPEDAPLLVDPIYLSEFIRAMKQSNQAGPNAGRPQSHALEPSDDYRPGQLPRPHRGHASDTGQRRGPLPGRGHQRPRPRHA